MERIHETWWETKRAWSQVHISIFLSLFSSLFFLLFLFFTCYRNPYSRRVTSVNSQDPLLLSCLWNPYPFRNPFLDTHTLLPSPINHTLLHKTPHRSIIYCRQPLYSLSLLSPPLSCAFSGCLNPFWISLFSPHSFSPLTTFTTPSNLHTLCRFLIQQSLDQSLDLHLHQQVSRTLWTFTVSEPYPVWSHLRLFPSFYGPHHLLPVSSFNKSASQVLHFLLTTIDPVNPFNILSF